MSDTKNMITDDNPNYWDALYLADELYDQGKYEEAEELYKKIVGEEDETGDANAHYGYLLDKLGRYEEAYSCFDRVLYGYADTSVREGVVCFLGERCCDEDSPYWRWFNDLDMLLVGYLGHCKSIDKEPEIEKILLNYFESKEGYHRNEARRQLIQIYGTGKCVLMDREIVSVFGFPNVEKLKAFVAETIDDEEGVWDMINAFSLDSSEMDEANAKAMEAALLSVQSDEAHKLANTALFDIYFSGSVYSAFDGDWYEIPFMKDQHKAAEQLLKIDIESAYKSTIIDFEEEDALSVLESAHKMAPDRADAAFYLFMYVDVYRFAELIREISDDCARDLIAEDYAGQLYELCLCDDEDEYFETYYLALLDFFCKYDPAGEYCDTIKQMLLSAYQFDPSELKNEEKAEAFAKKYDMELLSEPFDI